MFRLDTVCTVFLAGIVGSTAALAAELDTSQGLLAVNKEAGGEISLTVSGPGDYHFRDSGSGSLLQNNGALALADVGIFLDGSYTYEVTEISYNGQQTVNDPVNGRENAVQKLVTFSKTTSGHFTVLNGNIVIDNGIAED